MSPILDAVLSSNVNTVRDVVTHGAPLDEADAEQHTPLMEAVLTNQPEMVRVLLDAGVDVNAGDNEGWTALHFAAQDFLLNIAGELLSRGANVDALDLNGNTPLWRAVFNSRGRSEMIRLLLTHGANKDLPNKTGVSPSRLAASITNFDVARFLDERS